jgi:hypothetical protein
MFAHFWAKSAALRGRHMVSIRKRLEPTPPRPIQISRSFPRKRESRIAQCTCSWRQLLLGPRFRGDERGRRSDSTQPKIALAPTIGIIALSLLTSACVTTPSAPYAGPDPSDPGVRVPAAGYRSTLGRYTSQRPVEPAPWREQNERVTPAPKP